MRGRAMALMTRRARAMGSACSKYRTRPHYFNVVSRRYLAGRSTARWLSCRALIILSLLKALPPETGCLVAHTPIRCHPVLFPRFQRSSTARPTRHFIIIIDLMRFASARATHSSPLSSTDASTAPAPQL
jgi:hypothetical protein